MHRRLEEAFKDADDVVLFHLQTVFEGARSNTPERGAALTKKQGVSVPVGQDARVDGDRVSLAMRQFGTGGTPWTVVIDREGIVRVSEFTPGDTDALIKKIQGLRAKK